VERLAKGKHSSLLRKSVNYVRKKFYSTGPRGFIHDRNIFIIQATELSKKCQVIGRKGSEADRAPGANVIYLFTAVSCDFS
jgi:hypothetical protein